MESKYGFEFPKETVEKTVARLTNQIWKLIPMRENNEDWQRAGLLSALMEKLQQLSQKTLTEAQQEGMITIYKNFPPLSDFKVPKHIRGSVNWAAIKDVKGQKGRVAGYVDGNVFYIVFLDKEHKFYKMRKK